MKIFNRTKVLAGVLLAVFHDRSYGETTEQNISPTHARQPSDQRSSSTKNGHGAKNHTRRRRNSGIHLTKGYFEAIIKTQRDERNGLVV
jgi:hypothetical protein